MEISDFKVLRALIVRSSHGAWEVNRKEYEKKRMECFKSAKWAGYTNLIEKADLLFAKCVSDITAVVASMTDITQQNY